MFGKRPGDGVREALLSELSDVGGRIASYLETSDRLLAAGMTLLTVAATVVVVKGYWIALAGGPLALATLLSIVLHINSEALALGGYKAALEGALSRELGRRVIVWETVVAPLRHGTPPVVVRRGLLGLVFLIASASAVAASLETSVPGTPLHSWSTVAIVATSASVIVSVAAVAVSFVSEHRAFDSARRAAELALSQG